MDQKRSTRIFIGLIIFYGLLTALNVFLPQGSAASNLPTGQMPAPLPVVALVAGVGVVLLYGALGLLGLFLWRQLGLPELWDSAVTNRQRFMIPAVVGIVLGVLFIVADLVFAPINGIGRIAHPPFPTSIVASLAAGIGEETIFRLFFISLWTWLISRLILRGRYQPVVYWIVAVFSAIAFSVSHMPALMYLQGWTSMSQVPPLLLAEIILINSAISLPAAYLFRKYGFLSPAGVHFWADFVWHVVWGIL